MQTARLRWTDLRFAGGCALAAASLFNVLARPTLAPVAALATWALIAGLEAAWPRMRRSPAGAAPRRALALLGLYVPLQLALLAAGAWVAARSGWPLVFGLAFAVGFVTGAQGITYAHELGHAPGRADRALAWVLMASVLYPQFMVEHYRGHHLRAAMPDDPGTARHGETLWAFVPRALAGNLRGAWRLEAQRLRQVGRGWMASPLVAATVAAALLLAALAVLGGARAVAFWIAQAAFAVWLLETVNYVQHYGLQRRAGADGRREPFGPQHAWNADHAISTSVLANLPRHSDHHVRAGKRFTQLDQIASAPQLPTGYAGCLLIAAIPPWWFRLMHARLRA